MQIPRDTFLYHTRSHTLQFQPVRFVRVPNHIGIEVHRHRPVNSQIETGSKLDTYGAHSVTSVRGSSADDSFRCHWLIVKIVALGYRNYRKLVSVNRSISFEYPVASRALAGEFSQNLNTRRRGGNTQQR